MEELIYFESQDAALCGVHAVNNLLQGQYFSEVDFATIAHELDRKEREAFAEGGTDTPEYLQFIGQKSQNLADEGYFSVQVMEEAMKVWNLRLVQFNSEDAAQARENPAREMAYICNYQTHWFSIRRIGASFWNLNSLFKKPEKVSPTFLHMLLRQLQLEGYSIFVVVGQGLPVSPADSYVEDEHPELEEDPELAEAIRMSLQETAAPKETIRTEDPNVSIDNDSFEQAIAMSLNKVEEKEEDIEESVETMRARALAAALKRMEANSSQ